MTKIEEILDNNIYAKSGDCDCGYIGCGHYVEPEVVGKEKALEELSEYVEKEKKEAEIETKNKLLACINSFLSEGGVVDTDGTPLTFSPERF